FPWICPALQFNISMSNYSHILRRYKPSFRAEIYPFTHLFCTKLETIADQRLLEVLFSYGLEKTDWEEIDPYTAFLIGLEGDLPHVEASLPESTLDKYSTDRLKNTVIDKASNGV